MPRRSTSRKAAMTSRHRERPAIYALIRRRSPVAINLALQGGGAHGAFTWGVLDRLLEDGRFAPEGISGTSAGALNAVVLASGWLEGGGEGASTALGRFWRKIADLAGLRPLRAAGMSQVAADFAASLLSPYYLNPFDLNPLRSIVEELVDFERLRAARAPQLFIAATNLRTGRGRIFRNGDLSSKAVLASACLPQLYQAVEIDGEAYWDGAFASNPPLLPLVQCCRARDLVLVQINPIEIDTVPRTAFEIRNRVGEIVFGRPLVEELTRLSEAAGRAPVRRSHGSRPRPGGLRGIACTGSTAARCSLSCSRRPRSIRAGRWWRNCYDWGATLRTIGCGAAQHGVDHDKNGCREQESGPHLRQSRRRFRHLRRLPRAGQRHGCKRAVAQ
jgi:NTE family protein